MSVSSKKRALDLHTPTPTDVDYDGAAAMAQAEAERFVSLVLKPVMDDGEVVIQPVAAVAPQLLQEEEEEPAPLRRASPRLKGKAVAKQQQQQPVQQPKAPPKAKEKTKETKAQEDAVQKETGKAIKDRELRSLAKVREVRSAKAARALVRGAFPKPEHRQLAIVLWLTGIDSARSSKPSRQTVLLRDVEPLIAIGKTVLSLAYEAARKRHERKAREREEKEKTKGKEKGSSGTK